MGIYYTYSILKGGREEDLIGISTENNYMQVFPLQHQNFNSNIVKIHTPIFVETEM